jgi:HEPN domain-containing protein
LDEHCAGVLRLVPVKFTADDYRFAALERIGAAQALFETQRYAECVYLAGVATECILRAYRVRANPEFDSRHDLVELLTASNLEQLVPQKRRAEVGAALAEVWSRWKNDYRYATAGRLAQSLRKRGLFDGVRGDQLKANARIALDSSLNVVGIGAARWNKNS